MVKRKMCQRGVFYIIINGKWMDGFKTWKRKNAVKLSKCRKEGRLLTSIVEKRCFFFYYCAPTTPAPTRSFAFLRLMNYSIWFRRGSLYILLSAFVIVSWLIDAVTITMKFDVGFISDNPLVVLPLGFASGKKTRGLSNTW